jgi:hypothetical protein
VPLRHKEEGRGFGGLWTAPFEAFAVHKTMINSALSILVMLKSMARNGKLSLDQTVLSGP